MGRGGSGGGSPVTAARPGEPSNPLIKELLPLDSAPTTRVVTARPASSGTTLVTRPLAAFVGITADDKAVVGVALDDRGGCEINAPPSRVPSWTGPVASQTGTLRERSLTGAGATVLKAPVPHYS